MKKESSKNALLVNRGTDTNLDKSDISVNLQRNNRGPSFVMGCDGDAALI